MLRTIVKIDREKCTGCGLCAHACHEGAIAMVDGKAQLIRDDYCDGMGDCLPACPRGAISFEEREAAAYDEQAVRANLDAKKSKVKPFSSIFGKKTNKPTEILASAPTMISNWPVQIKLAPPKIDGLDGGNLLIAADCTAFTYGNFHADFIDGHTTLIGCPKLDGVDYSEKLSQILRFNDVKSIHLVRMQVPCCGGMELAVSRAIAASGKSIPFKITVISTTGQTVK